MKNIKIIVFIIIFNHSYASQAGLYWVGDSVNCSGGNVFNTLDQALLVAALNGDAADEIRLTDTVSYTGNGNGSYTLTDWSASGAGELTIVGGYPDCFGAVAGRTFVGDTVNEVFEVNTSNESSSVVTFRNIQMSLTSATRALTLSDGAVVTLDNVLISSNQSGVLVTGGSFLDVMPNSLIQFNGNTSNINGGGIYCTGNNSTVSLSGRLHRNQGVDGGNLHIRNGCYLEIQDGVRIEGRGAITGLDAMNGAGLYVDEGGEVFADGRANRVIFDGNKAETGGAIYLNGTGFAILQNTHINGSEAENGAAIYAKDGGTGVVQLTMDQNTDCGLLFRCSEIQNSRFFNSVVVAENALIEMSRTVIEQSDDLSPAINASILIQALNDGHVRLNRVGLIRNETYTIFNPNGGIIEAAHVTVAANNRNSNGTIPFSVFDSARSDGLIHFQNSIIVDTAGTDQRAAGTITGRCNLVDNDDNLSGFFEGYPAGSYHLGLPVLVNPLGGDARQLADSLGVDMCQQDTFAWSNEIDIENQAVPVNENTNPQGLPGDAGGLYDAGFDEVYDNIGEDEFLLTIEKEGGGDGSVVSVPGGIACGIDCTEVYFNGTIVTLIANAETGSELIQWLNCPLVNQDDECLVNMTASHTIRAVFEADDLIFRDDFE